MSQGNLCFRTGPASSRAVLSLVYYMERLFEMMGGEGKRAGMKSCSTRGRSESRPTFVTANVTSICLAREIRDCEVTASELQIKWGGKERGGWRGDGAIFMVLQM